MGKKKGWRRGREGSRKMEKGKGERKGERTRGKRREAGRMIA